MSTKTTIKRIALVAVSALGLGVLTSVAPASATGFGATSGPTGETVSVSLAATSPALRVGVASTVLVKFTATAVTAYSNDSGTISTGGYATSAVVAPNLKLLAAPATSTAAVTSAVGSSTNFSGTRVAVLGSAGNGLSSTAPQDFGALISNSSTKKSAVYAAFTFTPDKAGTYTFQAWDDVDTSGTVNGSTETVGQFSLVVTDGIATLAATTVINNGATTGTTYGAVVKISAKDSAGAATVPSGAETIKVSLTGSAVWKKSFVANGNVSGTGTADAYLTSADFDASGNAYLGLVDATAETVSVTPGIIGGLTTPSVTTSTVTFATPTTYIADNTSAAVTADVTSTVKDSASYYVVPGGTGASITFTAANTSASKIAAIGLVEVTGAAYGNANIIGITTVTTTSAGLYKWSAPTPGPTAGYSYKVVVGGADADTAPAVTSLTTTSGGNSFTIATVLKDSDATGMSVSPSSPTVATGATVTLVVTVEDSYGNARAGIAVTPSISGRNSGKQIASVITDADGKAAITYTDTNASGVATTLTDTVTFTTTSPLGSSVSKAATVTYVSGLTVSTVKVTTHDTTLGVANMSLAPKAIYVADGAENTQQSISAKVTTSTGAVMAGIAVTFSVAGNGAAIPSTKKTVYTDSTGVATSAIYGWKSGTYTVTATSGGVSGTGTETFYSTGNDSVRTVAASTEGNVVIGTATDRFGNPVASATLYAKVTSGNGYFGSGSLSVEGTTDSNGQAKWVIGGGSATVTVSNISFSAAAGTQVGQTSAPKGHSVNALAASLADYEFTAYTAGTATTDEEGVGASFDAAGVSSASVDVTSIGSSDSVDAANEATDAANAATDAANAAAEAADAATAAAQDAQAAVAELATKVASLIAGIKAQITTLTNLVIKIQKKVRA